MVKSANFTESIQKKDRKSDCDNEKSNTETSRGLKKQQIFIISERPNKKDSGEELQDEALNRAEAQLQYFVEVYREMSGYEGNMYNSNDIEVIKRFEQLSHWSKLLFIDLFNSDFRWIEANQVKIKFINILDSIVELTNARLINISSTILLCEDPQETYMFLYNLKYMHAKTLKRHLKNQLNALFNIDSVDIVVTKPWNTLLHYYSKLSTFKDLFSELGQEVFEEVKSNKSMEILEIFKLLSYFIENVKINQIDLLEFLSPPDFPGFFKLDSEVAFFFSRIHHAASYYSAEKIFANFHPYLGNKLKPITYRKTLRTHPIYINYYDTVESESAYSFELLLEKLIKKNLTDASYRISKEIIRIRNVCELTLDQFLEFYDNPNNFDWKIAYHSDERWARVLNVCLTPLMKSKDWNLSISTLIYLLIRSNYIEKRSYWWERLINIVEKHIHLPRRSLKVNQLAVSDPFVRTGDYAKFESLLHKSFGQLPSLTVVNLSNENYSEIPIPVFQDNLQLVQIPGEANTSIETHVTKHYTERNWKTYACKDTLLTSIYGVLMWEIIYDDSVEFVFQTSYQSLPLDFFSDNFYRNRHKKFKEMIALLSDPEKACNIFENNYIQHFNKNSVIIKWDLLESMIIEEIFLVINCLGASFAQILKVFCKDFKSNALGMPEFLVLNETEIKFAKVNCLNNRLTDQQEMWVKRLVKCGIKVELLHLIKVNENRL